MPTPDTPSSAPRFSPLLLITLALIPLLVYSGIAPYERITWFLEVLPVLIALPLLWLTRERFPLTGMLYGFIFLHACILIVGGLYSYARVPLGFELAEWFGLARNPYDKIGHFFQGFVPALIVREILIRGRFVRGRKMLAFLTLCTVLAISAFYELIEWWAALALGQGADEFLGTQGDPWDTQSDMFFALLGGLTALLLCARWHDRALARLPAPFNTTQPPAGETEPLA